MEISARDKQWINRQLDIAYISAIYNEVFNKGGIMECGGTFKGTNGHECA